VIRMQQATKIPQTPSSQHLIYSAFFTGSIISAGWLASVHQRDAVDDPERQSLASCIVPVKFRSPSHAPLREWCYPCPG
jgi:hypothetical protein